MYLNETNNVTAIEDYADMNVTTSLNGSYAEKEEEVESKYFLKWPPDDPAVAVCYNIVLRSDLRVSCNV